MSRLYIIIRGKEAYARFFDDGSSGDGSAKEKTSIMSIRISVSRLLLKIFLITLSLFMV